MGLEDGHPEKEGVVVRISELVGEVQRRLEQDRKIREMTVNAAGLRVVDGVKGEDVKVGEASAGDADAPAPGA